MIEFLRDFGLVLAGWGLAQIPSIIKAWRQKRAVRRFIGLENEANLELMWSFWRDVTQPRPAGYDDETQFSLLADQLARARPPAWHHAVWQSQLPNAPFNLSDEEIRWIRELHTGLDRIAGLQSEIREFRQKRNQASDAGRSSAAERADEQLAARWHIFQGFYEDTFSRQPLLLLRSEKDSKSDLSTIEVPPFTREGINRTVPD